MNTIAGTQFDQVYEQGCTTKFNGRDGAYGKSAALWLADMKRHRREGSSPSTYLQHLDRHLEGEAEDKVKNTSSMRALIYRGYMQEAAESDVEDFHRALSDHFKLTSKEVQDHFKAIPWKSLMKLQQRTGEDLVHYYGRAQNLSLVLHGRDAKNDALPPSQISLRATVVCRFVAGLSGNKLKESLYQQHIHHHTVTLHQAFEMAEAQLKIMEVATRSDECPGKMQQQGGKKRKAPTNGEEADSVEEQRHTVVKPKLPTTAKGNESPGSAIPPAERRTSANVLSQKKTRQPSCIVRLRYSMERSNSPLPMIDGEERDMADIR